MAKTPLPFVADARRRTTAGERTETLGPESDGAAWAYWALLLVAAPWLLLQAVVPVDEFIHRSDDAFYYFQVAVNHPEHGRWTFDGIHSTNGVQPLWAVVLTVVAHGLAAIGVDDRWTIARLFVGLTALVHAAGVLATYRVLARLVPPAVAFTAAGAMAFPLVPVWWRTAGLENGLYGWLLAVAASAWLDVVARPDRRALAVRLGLILGVTTLARLNAGLLVVAVSFDLWRRTRSKASAIAVAAVAAACVLPYVAWNVTTTGHVLPVSAAAKAVHTALAFDQAGIDSWLSPAVVGLVWQAKYDLGWFVSTHVVDAFWIVGARLLTGTVGGLGASVGWLVVGALVLLRLVDGAAWGVRLRALARALAPLSVFGVVAVANAALSVWTYPTQIAYAITKWWLADAEIVLVVAASALVGAVVMAIGERMPAVRRWGLVGAAAVVALHVVAGVSHYWDGRRTTHDWTLSWNEHPYRAAEWLRDHVPHTARVGAWNAGILGYFAPQPVVNLDGLINDFDLLPYLAEGQVADYILERRIEYLADIESLLVRYGIADRLELEPVYRERSPLLNADYVVMRVVGPRAPPPEARWRSRSPLPPPTP